MRVWIVLLSLLLSACSTTPVTKTSPVWRSPDPVQETLWQQYQSWKGTPYQFGGMSQQGVDCSGLVYRVYHDGFGHTLPRTTQQQVRVGKSVARDNIAPFGNIFDLIDSHQKGDS